MEVVPSKLNWTQALTEFESILLKDQIAVLQTLLTLWHMEGNILRRIKIPGGIVIMGFFHSILMLLGGCHLLGFWRTSTWPAWNSIDNTLLFLSLFRSQTSLGLVFGFFFLLPLLPAARWWDYIQNHSHSLVFLISLCQLICILLVVGFLISCMTGHSHLYHVLLSSCSLLRPASCQMQATCEMFLVSSGNVCVTKIINDMWV